MYETNEESELIIIYLILLQFESMMAMQLYKNVK